MCVFSRVKSDRFLLYLQENNFITCTVITSSLIVKEETRDES